MILLQSKTQLEHMAACRDQDIVLEGRTTIINEITIQLSPGSIFNPLLTRMTGYKWKR